MKKTIQQIFLLLLLVIPAMSNAQFNKNVVIAHRGAWKTAGIPENSIASLEQAIKLGCFGSEFDVHLTRDNIIVVNHDKDFYGMDIAASTYQDLASKTHPNGEKIPTAEAYLKAGIKQSKTKLIYEIKASSAGKERTLELTRLSVALVKKLHAEKWVEYISFDYDACKLVHELDPATKISYLSGDKAPGLLKADGLTGFDYHFSVLKANPGWISDARKLGLTSNAWTVNNQEDMSWLLEQQIDFLTTNEPELLFSKVKDRQKN